jgi:DNA-binding winged helix-turn-helix (wHTH) protein
MRVLIVGGREQDGERLQRIAARAGLELEVERVSPPRGARPELVSVEEVDERAERPLALLFEALERAELAVPLARALKDDAVFEDAGLLIAVSAGHVARLGEGAGFDDFMLYPYAAEELDGRLRSLQARNARRQNDDIVVDRAGQEVRIEGRNVALTAKEFALLAYLSERRGRVFSREHLLDRVWGSHYAVGSRTVDIHVRRLRAKLGAALPLETLRGRGYKLRREASKVASLDSSALGLASE